MKWQRADSAKPKRTREHIVVVSFMTDYRNNLSWSADVHQRIALAARRDPKIIGVFADRLRSKIVISKSAAAVDDDHWEWYIVLTLWSPLQVIRLLEDSSERAMRLRKTSPFLSLLSEQERSRLLSGSFSS